MTRELNKQWRDDERPSFRNTPSNPRGDEQFSRPARPRLSREVVDRAWKDGAQPHHSDYHPRTSNRPYTQNGRNGQRSEYSSSQSRPGNNNFNGNRRDNGQRFERSSSNYQGPRSRSFESDRRYTDDRRFGERNDYNKRPDNRGGHNSNRPQDMQDYRDRGRSFGSERGPERNERYDRPRQGSNSPRGRTFARDDRQRGPRRFPQNRPYQEQFEGDYERFTDYNEPKAYEARPQQRTYERDTNDGRPEPKRHVTPMQDGRVLKGSRPQQRKQAQFWTDVMDDTEELIQKVQAPETAQEPTISEVESTQPKKSERKKRATTSEQPRRRAAIAVTRKKNAGSASPAKPHATGPRPSQRGFKWPTA